MFSWMAVIWERVAKNWKTSSAAIVAAAAIVIPYFGFDVTSQELAIVIVGFQAFVLLFAKD